MHLLALWSTCELVTHERLLQLGRFVTLVFGTAQAARHMHAGLLRHLLQLRMGWFDTTPSGRVISVLSKDMRQGTPPSNLG